MALQVICAPLAERLEAHVFSLLGEAHAAGRRALVLVPAQASFLMETQILDRLRLPCFARIEVLSFEKLTDQLLQADGGRARARVDAAGTAMLARRALSQLSPNLRILGDGGGSLHQSVAQLIAALKPEDISSEQLRALAQDAQPPLCDKLLDLADLCDYLHAQAQSGLLDAYDAEEFARAQIAHSAYVSGAQVIIHGFETLPAARVRTVCELLKAGCEVTVTLEAAERDPVLQKPWALLPALEGAARAAGCGCTVQTLSDPPHISPQIQHLFDNLYAYSPKPYGRAPAGIRLVSAADKRQEAEYAAARILELTCEHGLKMCEIGVLAAQPQSYAGVLRDVFSQCGIPFFLEGKRPLSQHRLAVLVLSAADILTGARWRMFDVLRHLKTGLLPVSRAQADALSVFAKERGSKGFHFKNGFLHAPEALEAMRAAAFGPLAALQARAKGQSAAGLAALLAEYLETIGVAARLEEEASALAQAGFAAEARYTEQAYPRMAQLLGQVQALCADIPAKDLRELLTAGLESLQIAVVPPTTDEIVVGDVTHSIFPHKRVLFVLGANDGVLPALPDGAGVLTEREVELLSQSLPFPGRMRFEEQKLYIRRALCAADRLVVSYNAQDGPPSYLVGKLRAIFPGLEATPAAGVLPRAPRAALAHLAGELRALADGQNPALRALPLYVQNQQARPALDALLPALSFSNAPDKLSPALARKLYGGELKGSVSVVESYFSCPYRHFLDYAIRPQEPKRFEESAQDVGVYTHALMDGVTRALRAQGKSWGALTDEDVIRLVDEAAAGEFEAHNNGIFAQSKRFAFTEKRLRQEVAAAVCAVRTHLAGTGVRVAASELRFGAQDELRIETPAGSLSLRGVIDRVDLAEANGETFVRVVDYKTGDRDFRLADLYCGLNLQLFVYLIAAAELFKDTTPAGGFYFHIDLPYTQTDGERARAFRMKGFLVAERPAAYALDAAREKGLVSMNLELAKPDAQEPFSARTSGRAFSRGEMQLLMNYTRRLLARAVQDIYAGRADISPACRANGTAVCDHCDYLAVCRFDPAFSGNAPREVRKTSKEQILQTIAQEEPPCN